MKHFVKSCLCGLVGWMLVYLSASVSELSFDLSKHSDISRTLIGFFGIVFFAVCFLLYFILKKK